MSSKREAAALKAVLNNSQTAGDVVTTNKRGDTEGGYQSNSGGTTTKDIEVVDKKLANNLEPATTKKTSKNTTKESNKSDHPNATTNSTSTTQKKASKKEEKTNKVATNQPSSKEQGKQSVQSKRKEKEASNKANNAATITQSAPQVSQDKSVNNNASSTPQLSSKEAKKEAKRIAKAQKETTTKAEKGSQKANQKEKSQKAGTNSKGAESKASKNQESKASRGAKSDKSGPNNSNNYPSSKNDKNQKSESRKETARGGGEGESQQHNNGGGSNNPDKNNESTNQLGEETIDDEVDHDAFWGLVKLFIMCHQNENREFIKESNQNGEKSHSADMHHLLKESKGADMSNFKQNHPSDMMIKSHQTTTGQQSHKAKLQQSSLDSQNKMRKLSADQKMLFGDRENLPTGPKRQIEGQQDGEDQDLARQKQLQNFNENGRRSTPQGADVTNHSQDNQQNAAHMMHQQIDGAAAMGGEQEQDDQNGADLDNENELLRQGGFMSQEDAADLLFKYLIKYQDKINEINQNLTLLIQFSKEYDNLRLAEENGLELPSEQDLEILNEQKEHLLETGLINGDLRMNEEAVHLLVLSKDKLIQEQQELEDRYKQLKEAALISSSKQANQEVENADEHEQDVDLDAINEQNLHHQQLEEAGQQGEEEVDEERQRKQQLLFEREQEEQNAMLERQNKSKGTLHEQIGVQETTLPKPTQLTDTQVQQQDTISAAQAQAQNQAQNQQDQQQLQEQEEMDRLNLQSILESNFGQEELSKLIAESGIVDNLSPETAQQIDAKLAELTIDVPALKQAQPKLYEMIRLVFGCKMQEEQLAMHQQQLQEREQNLQTQQDEQNVNNMAGVVDGLSDQQRQTLIEQQQQQIQAEQDLQQQNIEQRDLIQETCQEMGQIERNQEAFQQSQSQFEESRNHVSICRFILETQKQTEQLLNLSMNAADLELLLQQYPQQAEHIQFLFTQLQQTQLERQHQQQVVVQQQEQVAELQAQAQAQQLSQEQQHVVQQQHHQESQMQTQLSQQNQLMEQIAALTSQPEMEHLTPDQQAVLIAEHMAASNVDAEQTLAQLQMQLQASQQSQANHPNNNNLPGTIQLPVSSSLSHEMHQHHLQQSQLQANHRHQLLVEQRHELAQNPQNHHLSNPTNINPSSSSQIIHPPTTEPHNQLPQQQFIDQRQPVTSNGSNQLVVTQQVESNESQLPPLAPPYKIQPLLVSSSEEQAPPNSQILLQSKQISGDSQQNQGNPFEKVVASDIPIQEAEQEQIEQVYDESHQVHTPNINPTHQPSDERPQLDSNQQEANNEERRKELLDIEIQAQSSQTLKNNQQPIQQSGDKMQYTEEEQKSPHQLADNQATPSNNPETQPFQQGLVENQNQLQSKQQAVQVSRLDSPAFVQKQENFGGEIKQSTGVNNDSKGLLESIKSNTDNQLEMIQQILLNTNESKREILLSSSAISAKQSLLHQESNHIASRLASNQQMQAQGGGGQTDQNHMSIHYEAPQPFMTNPPVVVQYQPAPNLVPSQQNSQPEIVHTPSNAGANQATPKQGDMIGLPQLQKSEEKEEVKSNVEQIGGAERRKQEEDIANIQVVQQDLNMLRPIEAAETVLESQSPQATVQPYKHQESILAPSTQQVAYLNDKSEQSGGVEQNNPEQDEKMVDSQEIEIKTEPAQAEIAQNFANQQYLENQVPEKKSDHILEPQAETQKSKTDSNQENQPLEKQEQDAVVSDNKEKEAQVSQDSAKQIQEQAPDNRQV